MFVGVVVIDGQGIVCQVNEQVKVFLGELLEGELWCIIIVCLFKFCVDDGYEVFLYDGCWVKLFIMLFVNELGQFIVLIDLIEICQL